MLYSSKVPSTVTDNVTFFFYLLKKSKEAENSNVALIDNMDQKSEV